MCYRQALREQRHTPQIWPLRHISSCFVSITRYKYLLNCPWRHLMRLNQAFPSADRALAHPTGLHTRMSPVRARSLALYFRHFSLPVHVSCMLTEIGRIQRISAKNPYLKMAESLIMHTCTGKQDSYPRLPFSAILGCTSCLAPATDSPQSWPNSANATPCPACRPAALTVATRAPICPSRFRAKPAISARL